MNQINDHEKLSINLSVVELAQIDVLVEQGLYSNRSDVIRSALRKQLEAHKDVFERQLTPISGGKNWIFNLGIQKISRRQLESIAAKNSRLRLSVIGMLVVDFDVSAELFERSVEHVSLKGKLVASDEIKEVVARMR